MSDFAVECIALTKVYPARQKGRAAVTAVTNINLHIRPGEFFTLLGASGSGKTTTLRLIAGFIPATHGEILLQGEPVSHLPPYKPPIHTVFQNYALFPHMSVADNVAFGLRMQQVGRPERERRVREALEMVRLPDVGPARPHELSGGQQQRVALARALINRPAVLLLDEPLSALDLKLRQAMRLELKGLQSQLGITFIYVTHDQEEALTMSDRIAVMHDGRVEQVAPPDEIYHRPKNRFVADFIGETNFLQGEVTAVENDHIQLQVNRRLLRIPGRNASALPLPGKATLALRPEMVYVARTTMAAARQGLTGCVEEVAFLGTDTRYLIRLEDGSKVTSMARNLNGDGPLAVGEAVEVYWPENGGWLLNS